MSNTGLPNLLVSEPCEPPYEPCKSCESCEPFVFFDWSLVCRSFHQQTNLNLATKVLRIEIFMTMKISLSHFGFQNYC